MTPRRAAVLGSPIAHSLSPALHRAAYAALDLDWTYDAVEVDEAGLEGFIAGLDDSWAGLSLTMPLKEAVLSLLAEVDPLAATLRSVNTVLPAGDGSWTGTNTDVDGIVEALHRAGVDDAPATATILGAGATARSVAAALARLGTSAVVVCARRPAQAREVAALAHAVGVPGTQVAGLEPLAELVAADVVVSTLPGDAAVSWAELAGDAPGVLLDASYHPWPTPLAAAWPAGRVASGRDMLLWQAVRQVELMTGRPAPSAAMAAALPPG